jgi:hypothetical protein
MDNLIHIKASKNQLSKLKNGHNVRISQDLEGKGVNLMVEPSTYALAKKAFMKGKGLQIKLSPKEIAINKQIIPHMKGTGIFGKKFDRVLDKYGVKEAAYKVGDALKPGVQAAILGGLGTAATALSATELVASGGLGAGAIPAIYSGAGALGYLATDYLDNPSKYQSKANAGPRDLTAASTLAGQMAKQEALNQLSQQTGENYNTLGNANLMTAIANKDKAALTSIAVDNLTNSIAAPPKKPLRYATSLGILGAADPNGLYDEDGSYIGIGGRGVRGRKRREVGSIMGQGAFVGMGNYKPQALQSQPFSANFQFSKTLPPQYARWTK